MPGADHQQAVAAAQPGAVLRAQHAGERLDQRRQRRVQAVDRQQLVDQLGGHAHLLGEPAGVEADRAEALAQRLVAAAAAPALAAGRVVVDRDAVAGGDDVHTLADGHAPRRRARGRAPPGAFAPPTSTARRSRTRRRRARGRRPRRGRARGRAPPRCGPRPARASGRPSSQQRRDGLGVHRRGDAALGHQRGDQLGGRHVERRVARRACPRWSAACRRRSAPRRGRAPRWRSRRRSRRSGRATTSARRRRTGSPRRGPRAPGGRCRPCWRRHRWRRRGPGR